MVNLKDMLRNYATGLGVKLIVAAPKLTKVTLERLLQQNPQLFEEIVPQGIDQQTGVFAKKYFEENLIPKRLKEAGLECVPVSYALVDVDNLKDINDTYGHDAGHAAIKYIVDVINSSFRVKQRRRHALLSIKHHFYKNKRGKPNRRSYASYDLVGRIEPQADTGRVGYGDEFGVLLYGCNQEQALEVMGRFLENIRSKKVQYEQSTIDVTVSIGVAQYTDGVDPQELISRADKALYNAKKGGRNKVVGFIS